MHDLEDPLGPRQVAQPVLAEIDQLDPSARVATSSSVAQRDHDLTTVRDRT